MKVAGKNMDGLAAGFVIFGSLIFKNPFLKAADAEPSDYCKSREKDALRFEKSFLEIFDKKDAFQAS